MGETTVHVDEFTILSKFNPAASDSQGERRSYIGAVTDPEMRYRQRYVDLIEITGS